MNINSLPDEILNKEIFGKLERWYKFLVARVCKRWWKLLTEFGIGSNYGLKILQEGGSKGLIQLLIDEKHIDMNYINCNYVKEISDIIADGDFVSFSVLFKNGLIIDHHIMSCIGIYGRGDWLEYLESNKVTLNKISIGCIYQGAANGGHLPLLKRLKQKKWTPCKEVITEAVKSGHINVLKWAIRNKCQFNSLCPFDSLCSYVSWNDVKMDDYVQANYCPKRMNGFECSHYEDRKRKRETHIRILRGMCKFNITDEEALQS
jgi:hypothetical protein